MGEFDELFGIALLPSLVILPKFWLRYVQEIRLPIDVWILF